MNSYVIPKATDIVVTKHAQKRFLERFRLYFVNTRITSTFLWENLIMAQVSTGSVCHRWTQVPFYRNMIAQKYGETVVIKKKPCYYICKKISKGRLMVITVVPEWYND